MNPLFGTTDDFSEKPLDHFESTCKSNCFHCDIKEPDFTFFESKSKLYILAIVDVHPTNGDPMGCGAIRDNQVN